MSGPLIETWEVNSRINLYLLDALSQEVLGVELKPKGRTIGGLFVHMHSVRLMWLKAAAPTLLSQVKKIEADKGTTTAQLHDGLMKSGVAISELIATAVANGGRVKSFKPHVTALVGYLISHESHHRGQAAMAFRIAGAPLEKGSLSDSGSGACAKCVGR
jgi:uncharacterized damage-inducible protein DinB